MNVTILSQLKRPIQGNAPATKKRSKARRRKLLVRRQLWLFPPYEQADLPLRIDG
jgi:hypothetical protein